MVTSLDIRPTYLTRIQNRRKVGLAPKMPKQPQFIDKQKRVLNRRNLFETERQSISNFSPRLLSSLQRMKK